MCAINHVCDTAQASAGWAKISAQPQHKRYWRLAFQQHWPLVSPFGGRGGGRWEGVETGWARGGMHLWGDRYSNSFCCLIPSPPPLSWTWQGSSQLCTWSNAGPELRWPLLLAAITSEKGKLLFWHCWSSGTVGLKTGLFVHTFNKHMTSRNLEKAWRCRAAPVVFNLLCSCEKGKGFSSVRRNWTQQWSCSSVCILKMKGHFAHTVFLHLFFSNKACSTHALPHMTELKKSLWQISWTYWT